MNRIKLIILIIVSILTAIQCKTPVKKIPGNNLNNSHIRYKISDNFNFLFVGSNIDISNPKYDKRSFYKIYIDKIESGRTNTGLESQEKTYKGKLSINRHLLHVEKWVLNKRAGRYVKLNNIDQPKPDYFYFSTTTDKIVIIRMKSKKNGKSIYNQEYEIND